MTGEELREALEEVETRLLDGASSIIIDAARAFLPILERDEKLVKRLRMTLLANPSITTSNLYSVADKILDALIPGDKLTTNSAQIGDELVDDAPSDPYLWESGT